MAPLSFSRDEPLLGPGDENFGGKRKEILYDGYYYDVTDWIDRHPGGKVIEFYTESGEDATCAIQQFHNRSAGRVQGLMKAFKKRPAKDQESKSSTFCNYDFFITIFCLFRPHGLHNNTPSLQPDH